MKIYKLGLHQLTGAMMICMKLVGTILLILFCLNKFEFLFDRSKDMDNPKVYRRMNGKFVLIGNLLAEKQGAYVIWEDKYFFTTTDFAWTFDKVTSKLSSVVLSIGMGTDNLDKIPKPMTCMQKIFYY